MMKKALLLLLFGSLCASTFAQSDQLPETDPVITNRISQWQDLKFGFMMHWGMYAQWEVVESWSICSLSAIEYLLVGMRYIHINVFVLEESSPLFWVFEVVNLRLQSWE